MSQNQSIGIVGATGEVGQSVAIALRKLGFTNIKVCARRKPENKVAENLAHCKIIQLDLQDQDALEDFVSDCEIVVNCAGPSHRVKDRVAQVALKAGAHYVDVAGDEPLHAQLLGSELLSNCSAVLSAGLLPGLSTLLPRWLAATEFDQCKRLTVYTGGLERGSRMGAADFLLSLEHADERALAAIRGGVLTQRALTPRIDAALPFFPGYVSAQPYLSEESERLALELGIDELDWYNVLVGEQLRAELNRLRSVSWGQASEEELIAGSDRLVSAASLDLVGRDPYQLFVVILEGKSNGEEKACTTVLRMNDSYRMSGAMGALSAAAILRGDIAPGVHYAAEVLNPQHTMKALSELGVIGSFEVLEGCLEDEEEVEGVL